MSILHINSRKENEDKTEQNMDRLYSAAKDVQTCKKGWKSSKMSLCIFSLRVWKDWPNNVLHITLGGRLDLNQSLQP